MVRRNKKISKLIPVIVVCSKSEEKEISPYFNMENTYIINGDISFLSELIAHCSFFLGNDSSPSHIAASWNKPRIVAYNASKDDLIKWAPMNPENCKVILKDEFLKSGIEDSLNWIYSQKNNLKDQFEDPHISSN